ncbi:MAG: hypothetical protein MZV65_14675 [Chromatiales bacterium]|nr:hypothetical protein [Chromatiales bacterium]
MTRERLYLETMQQVLSNTTKVMVDQKGGSNLLYLPLDKLMQMPPRGADGLRAGLGRAAAAHGRRRARRRPRRRRRRADTRSRDAPALPRPGGATMSKRSAARSPGRRSSWCCSCSRCACSRSTSGKAAIVFQLGEVMLDARPSRACTSRCRCSRTCAISTRAS